MSYTFIDGYGSVLTAASSVIAGAHQPIVQIGYTPELLNVRGTGSVNGVASVALIAAAGAGLKNYITDVFVANTGSVATLVTFTDGDASVLGKTIAPALGGSNLPGLKTPMVTSANQPFNMVSATAASVLHGTALGYKA